MALPPAGSDSVSFTGPIPLAWPQVADTLTGVQVQVTPVSAGVVPESVTVAPSAALGPPLRTTIWYRTTAPGIAGVLRKLLLMLRSAAATWVVTVFVSSEPCWADGPVQLVKSNVQRAWLLIRPALAESMCTWRVTVAVVPAATVPSGTPATGSAPGWTTPLTVRLLLTNDVPAGGASKNTTLLASTSPVELSIRIV